MDYGSWKMGFYIPKINQYSEYLIVKGYLFKSYYLDTNNRRKCTQNLHNCNTVLRFLLCHTSLQFVIHSLVSDDKIQTMIFFFKVVNSVPLMPGFCFPCFFNLLQFL